MHVGADSISKPKTFGKMKELAAVLSKGFPHLRVDFYDVDGSCIFGELTFYHFGGIVPFEPQEWDLKFGEWITLPEVEKKRRITTDEHIFPFYPYDYWRNRLLWLHSA